MLGKTKLKDAIADLFPFIYPSVKLCIFVNLCLSIQKVILIFTNSFVIKCILGKAPAIWFSRSIMLSIHVTSNQDLPGWIKMCLITILLYQVYILNPYLSSPLQEHSNLSKMQSFSYNEHNLLRKYSWTWYVSIGFVSIWRSHTLTDK